MTHFKYPITTQRKSPEPMGRMAPPTYMHNNKEQNNNTRGETCKSCSLLIVLWRLLCLSENLHHGRRLLCHLETGWQWEFWWLHESTRWVTAFFSLFVCFTRSILFYYALFCFISLTNATNQGGKMTAHHVRAFRSFFCADNKWNVQGVFVKQDVDSHILPLCPGQVWALPPGRLAMWPSRL